MQVTTDTKILSWMMADDGVGASARAMAGAAVQIYGGRSHPYDPSDFNRCLKLVKSVPEIKDNFDRVAALSKTWAKLIDRWGEVEKCFIDEVGFDWGKGDSAPETRKLIRSIIN